MTGFQFQTSRMPYYCSRCGSVYPQPEQLVECLLRHEETDRRLDGWQPEPAG